MCGLPQGRYIIQGYSQSPLPSQYPRSCGGLPANHEGDTLSGLRIKYFLQPLIAPDGRSKLRLDVQADERHTECIPLRGLEMVL